MLRRAYALVVVLTTSLKRLSLSLPNSSRIQ
ncbi:Conserved hypothetical protein [Prochlorococcus marinus str. MIT 9303]|uniref:Uncharacterized protein n=1 Tax=Prochlorococcus marinus (strain MIT 9303) TaxID=59922 RepID=A2CCU6_PROM3|nr:Conserved hypothetical protein [Prochlorococcus marinus str. MIT 9303]